MTNETQSVDFDRRFEDCAESSTRNPLDAIERNTDLTVGAVQEVAQAIADQRTATTDLYVDLGLHWAAHHDAMRQINKSLRLIAGAALFIAVFLVFRAFH